MLLKCQNTILHGIPPKNNNGKTEITAKTATLKMQLQGVRVPIAYLEGNAKPSDAPLATPAATPLDPRWFTRSSRIVAKAGEHGSHALRTPSQSFARDCSQRRANNYCGDCDGDFIKNMRVR